MGAVKLVKICLVTPAFEGDKVRVQPGRYLYEICKNAERLGIQVKVLSDGYPPLPQSDQVEEVSVRRCKSVRLPPLMGNKALLSLIRQEAPDVVLWHVGLTSFLHLDLRGKTNRPIIGIFTSPVYDLRDFLRFGIHEVLFDMGSPYAHLLGAVMPSAFIRRPFEHGVFRSLIVLSDTARRALVQKGVPSEKIVLVPPGIDDEWFASVQNSDIVGHVRRAIGLFPEDFVVVYFGSPQPYRGIITLAHAVAIACRTLPRLKLLVLSRRRGREMDGDERRLRDLCSQLGIDEHVKIVTGFLARDKVVQCVASADVVALPFKLVPSEAPLSILESMALGKPVIATAVDGLPELLADGRGVLVQPNDTDALAQALVYLYEHPEVRISIGEKARDYARTRPRWLEVAREVMQIVDAQVC